MGICNHSTVTHMMDEAPWRGQISHLHPSAPSVRAVHLHVSQEVLRVKDPDQFIRLESHLFHVVATNEESHRTNTGQSSLTPTATLSAGGEFGCLWDPSVVTLKQAEGSNSKNSPVAEYLVIGG